MEAVADKKRKKAVIPTSIPTGEKVAMPDVHAIKDRRGVGINRVGVSDIRFPMILETKSGKKQRVLATFRMYGSLMRHVKGTNMSRFIEVLLEDFKTKPISGANFKDLLKALQRRLNSDDVYISAEFDYVVPKRTPATKRLHLTSHKCRFIGQILHSEYRFTVEASVLGAAYCPCSKEICLVDHERDIGKGAHGQRSLAILQVRTRPAQPGIWLEDMIELCEKSFSAELYPLLKRPDEKFVTEQGYDNPKYVEDIARDIIVKVKKLSTVRFARVSVTNYESIHPHDVECIIEISKKGKKWSQTNRGHV